MSQYKAIVQLGRIDVEGRRVTVRVEAKTEEKAIIEASIASIPKFKKIHGESNPILNKYRHIISIKRGD